MVCYHPPVMKPATRNRLIIGAAIVAAGIFLAVQMYYSQTPARHAGHDHAIAKIDAGGFLVVEARDAAEAGARAALVEARASYERATSLVQRQLAAQAQEDGFFDGEIMPIEAEQADGSMMVVDKDQAVRADTGAPARSMTSRRCLR